MNTKGITHRLRVGLNMFSMIVDFFL